MRFVTDVQVRYWIQKKEYILYVAPTILIEKFPRKNRYLWENGIEIKQAFIL